MSATTAYRNLFRAARLAFEGDANILQAAKSEIRSNFRKMQNLSASDPAVQPAITKAQEVATFLRQNVVQGKRSENGTYRLRIHDEIERGDNDTIKVAGKTVVVDGQKCCSQ